MKLIIEASNIRMGGGVTHITNLLKYHEFSNFESIKVYGNTKVLSMIPDADKIHKVSHPYLNSTLFKILLWKLFVFKPLLKQYKNDLIYVPAGNLLGKHKPELTVIMYRNMLPFSTDEIKKFSSIFTRLKFYFLRQLKSKTFKKAFNIIFISKYAKLKLQQDLNLTDKNFTIINHGVSDFFRNNPIARTPQEKGKLTLVYVSNFLPYKNQLPLVIALKEVVEKGYNIHLRLIGNTKSTYFKNVFEFVNNWEKSPEYVTLEHSLSQTELSNIYKQSDGFVFASSCENMPNILIEAMSAGLPILCSNRMPNPEFLSKDYPFLFDPEDISDIIENVIKFIQQGALRKEIASENYRLAHNYTWEKCALNTFNYLNYLSNN